MVYKCCSRKCIHVSRQVYQVNSVVVRAFGAASHTKACVTEIWINNILMTYDYMTCLYLTAGAGIYSASCSSRTCLLPKDRLECTHLITLLNLYTNK